jgi:steroid delta-isomerase-like uncharacterized protein
MSDNKLDQLARKTIDDFNRSDWDAGRASIGPGYVYEETGTGRRCEGADETVAAMQEWKAAIPDGTGEVLRVVVEGDTVVMELVWRGTQTGPMATGAGELPASGRSFEVLATMWQQWSGEQMVAERHHLDILSLLAQLGALPAPA